MSKPIEIVEDEERINSRSEAVSIRIELADGTMLVSRNSAHAEQVFSWWNNCEILAGIHGVTYAGELLLRKPTEES